MCTTYLSQRLIAHRKHTRVKRHAVDEDTEYVPIPQSPAAPICPIEGSGSESHDAPASSPTTASNSVSKKRKSTAEEQATGSGPEVATLSPRESAVLASALDALKGGAMKNAMRFVAMRVYYTARKRGASKENAAREAAPCMGDGTRPQHILELAEMRCKEASRSTSAQQRRIQTSRAGFAPCSRMRRKD